MTDSARSFVSPVRTIFRTVVIAAAVWLAGYGTALAQPLTHSQGPGLGTIPLGTVEIQLAASGGSGPGTYTWSLVGGALPPNIRLRTDVPSFFSSSANAGLIGVATTPGDYTFTLRVASGAATPVDRQYTLKIIGLVQADNGIPDAFLNRPYNYQLLYANNTGAVTYASTNTPPTGLTVSSSGLISGTPTVSGFFSINFSITDSMGTLFRSIGLNISRVRVDSPGSLPNATQGASYDYVVTASGGSGSFTFAACPGNTGSAGCGAGLQAFPSGLSMDSAGHITGTVTGGPGRTSLTITATDTNNVSYSKLMSIGVLGVPPTLPNINPYGNIADDLTIGVPWSRGLSTGGGGKAPFTWSANNLPPGMAIRSGSGNTSSYITPNDGEVLGTPTALGTYNVEITATDADGVSVSNTFPMRVIELQQRDFLNNGTINVPYSRTFRVIGGRPPYTVEQVPGGNLAAGLALDAANFRVSGTPLENNQINFSFDPIFKFTDADGRTVQARNYFGIAGTSTLYMNLFYDLGTRSLNSSTSITFTACCVPSFTWSLAGGALPPGMNLSSDGVLSGTPTAEGTYTFIIKAADATNLSNFTLRQYTLIITPLSITGNLPSVANVGTALALPLTPVTNGTAPYSFSLFPFNYLPPGLTLDTDGTVHGTLTAPGQYNFQVQVTDGVGRYARRFYGMSIYPAGVNPPLNLNVGPTIGPRGVGTLTQVLTTSGGRAPYHYMLTPGAPQIPGMRVQDGQPLPTNFTATGGFMGVIDQPGTYQTSIRVTDADGQFFDRALTVVVTSVNQLSQTTLPKGTIGTPYSFQLIPYGGSGNYSFSLTGSFPPPGLSLSSTGLISGTPTAPWTQSFNVQLTDLSTQETVGVFYTIVVDPFTIGVNGAPSGGVLPLATQNVFYNQMLTAPGCGSNCIFTSNLNSNGLTLGSNGAIQGTPIGTFNSSFTATATGSNGTASRVFSLQIVNSVPNPLAITTTTVGPTTVGNTTATALFAFGGTLPYSWSLVSGTLPTGLSLQFPGEQVGNLNPGFAYIAGRAMVAGVYTFTVRVTDANGIFVQRTFDWNVSRLAFQNTSLPLLLFNGTILNPLILDTPYTQPLLALGGTGIYTFVNTTPMPPGLGVSQAGVVSGTPANTGSVNTTMRVDDSGGNSIATNHTFNVSGPTATILNFSSGPNLGNFQQGFTTSFNVTPTGGTQPYTLTVLSPLPPGFALESGTSLLSGDAPGTFRVGGTPLATGPLSFTLKAVDNVGNVGVRTFTLSVSTLTRFSNATLADATVGLSYSQQLVAFDNSGAVVWTVSPTSGLPPGITLSSGGLLGGTPTTPGSYSFTLVGTDASGVGINFGFTMRISRVAIADPLILPVQATRGVPFNYGFTASAGGAGLVWSASGLPGGVTMAADGTISGTPTNAGASTVLVTATDGQVAFSRRFTLYTRLPNPSPLDSNITLAALGDATVGQSVTMVLSMSGGTPPYQWTVAAGSVLPPGMRLLRADQNLPDRAPGSTVLTGVPSTVGQYTFDLILTDAANQSVRRTFTMNVTPLYIVSVVPRSGTTGIFFSQRLLTVGGVPPYLYTIPAANLDAGLGDFLALGGLALSSDGVISGTPTSANRYVIPVKATDSAGNTFTRSLTLFIASPSGLNTFDGNPSDTSVGSGIEGISLTTNGPLGATYTWSVVSGTLPPGIVIDNSEATNPVLRGVPTIPGIYTFRLRAVDNSNPTSNLETIQVWRVAPIQIVSPPIAISQVSDVPSAHVGQLYSFTLKSAGGVPPYTYVQSPSVPLPTGITLSADGTLSGTPQMSGLFSIAPIISDAAGHVLNASSMTLAITPAGVPTPLVLASGGDELFPGSVGAPYIFPLLERFVLRGGTAPFTWSITAGSSLAPGLSLLPGGNGIAAMIAGVPTLAGEYETSLRVVDAAGQQLTISFQYQIFSLSLTPSTIGPFMVGTAVSVNLVPNGGVPPYSIFSFEAMPPGLTLSSSGLLSGTPTYAGNFPVILGMNDANGDESFAIYLVTVDNALGEAPALSVGPKPVQVFYQTGSPIPAPVPLNVTTTSGAFPFTVLTNGIPGASISAAGGTTSVGITFNPSLASLPIGTYNGVVAVNAVATANQFDVVPVTVVVSAPPPCGYTLNPPNASIPAAGGTGSFGVSTNPACTWSATVPPASAITITSPTSGAGVGTVSYRLSANPGATPRTLRVTVQGQQHTITQFGSNCNFVLGVSTLNAPAAGGTASISVTPSNASCPSWSASSATLGLSPLSATGAGTLVVTVPPNGGAAPRTMTAIVGAAGVDQKTLTVNQAGAACTVGLSPYNTLVPSAGASGQIGITVPSGCGYDTTSVPSWISVTSGGSGNGSSTLLYTVAPNSTTVQRVGTMTIGGQAFQVTQEPTACSVTVNTSSLGSPYAAGGGTGLVGVVANGSNCSWSAASDAPWAMLSVPGGSGNGSVGITLQSNAASVTPRSATLTIAGQTIQISQSGTACNYTLQSSAGTVPAPGGSGSVGVVAPLACTWGATSSDPTWLTVAAAGPNGTGEVQFLAQANPAGVQRQAALSIAGQTYTVTQAAAPCTYELQSANLTVASGAVSTSFGFSTAASACTPAAQSYAGWITNTVTSFAAGAGSVSFDVAPNPTTTTRVGTIRVGEQNFSVIQTGGQCGFSLNAYSAIFGRAEALDQSFAGSQSAVGCPAPPVGTDQSGFIHLGSLLGPVTNIFTLSYAIDRFDSLTPSIRFGNITFGGQIFRVKQTSY